jgi:hypothetical protein
MAVRALHFLATSAVIAETRSGTEPSTMQLSAVIAHPNFSLPNMTSLPLAVATPWSTPCSLRRHFGHSSQNADILVLAKGPYSGFSLGPNLLRADGDKAKSSGDLIPNDHDQLELGSNKVQFALVIARMIDTVHSSPEHMRQAVYDLARYKLRCEEPSLRFHRWRADNRSQAMHRADSGYQSHLLH